MFNNTKISRNEKEARAELLVERKGIKGGKLKKNTGIMIMEKGKKQSNGKKVATERTEKSKT